MYLQLSHSNPLFPILICTFLCSPLVLGQRLGSVINRICKLASYLPPRRACWQTKPVHLIGFSSLTVVALLSF